MFNFAEMSRYTICPNARIGDIQTSWYPCVSTWWNIAQEWTELHRKQSVLCMFIRQLAWSV